jgi:2-oxoglutarate dehydrogenase E2 component (dihydrolipoamide succinyltransferase)
LSPAVRRLVRQYDLDITGIHGTGPSGRIRVGDVIGMLGERTEPAGGPTGTRDEEIADAEPEVRAGAPYRPRTRPTADARSAAAPTTSIFECDLGRVLAHRKRQRLRGDEILLTSYYLVACTEAINAVPEVCATGADASLGITFGTTGGDSTTAIVDTAADTALGSLDSRLRELDRKLRAADDTAHRDAALWIHHYGASGSLLAVPTPLAAGHCASLGVGAVRRQVVVRAVDGVEAPRVAALCYLSLSFDLDRVTLDRANRFLAQLVRVLEQWPDVPT